MSPPMYAALYLSIGMLSFIFCIVDARDDEDDLSDVVDPSDDSIVLVGAVMFLLIWPLMLAAWIRYRDDD